MHDYDVHDEDNRQFPILFCQLLEYRPLELNSINIYQNWKIQRWIKAMKFKTARNSHFFKWRFQCWSCHLRRRWYELEQHKRRQLQLERQKSDRFRLAKQRHCLCIALFCTFRHCTATVWSKMPNFTFCGAHTVPACETLEWRKTINTKKPLRSQHKRAIGWKIIARKQRKTS